MCKVTPSVIGIPSASTWFRRGPTMATRSCPVSRRARSSVASWSCYWSSAQRHGPQENHQDWLQRDDRGDRGRGEHLELVVRHTRILLCHSQRSGLRRLHECRKSQRQLLLL